MCYVRILLPRTLHISLSALDPGKALSELFLDSPNTIHLQTACTKMFSYCLHWFSNVQVTAF